MPDSNELMAMLRTVIHDETGTPGIARAEVWSGEVRKKGWYT